MLDRSRALTRDGCGVPADHRVHNYRGSAQPTQPACTGVCDDLLKSERRPVASDAGWRGKAQELAKQARNLRIRTGLAPSLSALRQVALRFSPPGRAASFGWLIGSGIYAKLVEVETPDPPPVVNYNPTFDMVFAGGRWVLRSSYGRENWFPGWQSEPAHSRCDAYGLLAAPGPPLVAEAFSESNCDLDPHPTNQELVPSRS